MKLIHKEKGKVKMVGLEADGELYRTLLTVCKQEFSVAKQRTRYCRLWHISNEKIRHSTENDDGIPLGKEKGSQDQFYRCNRGKFARKASSTIPEHMKSPQKPTKRVYTDFP